MKKRLVLKPFVVPTLYLGFVAFIIGSLFLSFDLEKDKDDLTYVSSIILDDYAPVINVEDSIIRPYTSDKVEVLNDFYNYKEDDSKQLKSIIIYENTYIQNTGINYQSNEEFDIVSILDGEVVDVYDHELLGKTVTIKHDKNIVSTYQCMNDVTVKKNDKVLKGQIIGKSGSCSLINSGNNLHFELYINGNIVNPMEYFDKKLSDI